MSHPRPPPAAAVKDERGRTMSSRSRSRSSSRAGRALHRTQTGSTVSSSHQTHGFTLTHIHSSHVDDASVYQDPWHEADAPKRAVPPHEGPSDWDARESIGSTTDDEHDHKNKSAAGRATADDAATGVDLEKAESRRAAERYESTHSQKKEQSDPNLVTWDGPDDPANPKNWTKREKWVATLVVSSFTFISPVSSSMVAPSLGELEVEFGVEAFLGQMMLSIFVLAYAIGPLFIGPLSEIYGRVRVLQLANLVYLVFNTACGAATSPGMLIAFRFLAGLGGSAPLAIGGGVLADAWRTEERGAAIAIYSLMPLLGPAVGPLCGGFITQYSTWRWSFYSTSIADALIQISGLFFLRETYPPTLLHRRKLRLIKETGNADLYTPYDRPNMTLAAHLRTALVRPFRMLFTQPMVQALALYMACLYGTVYLMLSSFPLLWHDLYGQSMAIGGLNYIAIGLGFGLGAQTAARLQDRIYARLVRKEGKGRPEFRVPLMGPGALLTPVGLLIYGWCAAYETHWIGPDIGACIFAVGSIVGFQCIQTFIVDAYTRYAASAIAAITVLRSLAGFGFPLFAPAMYDALGFGWGNSVLALAAIVFGFPAPVMLWVFGQRLRAKSTFAAGG